ncbi:MAG: hypothetical protein LBE17_00005, partial [Treponema sp.]|nr:hypothetical protein [Treponema sp.]
EIKNAAARLEHIREHDEKNKIVTEEAVVFDERDGGLWLSYENYRALERNVIVLREYAAWLLLIAEYYREEWYVDNGLLFSILGAIVSAGGGKGAYKELYGVINVHGERIAALETSHDAVMKTLDELKLTVNNGFRELRKDLKELRKHT